MIFGFLIFFIIVCVLLRKKCNEKIQEDQDKEDYEQLYRENADLKEKVRLYQDQINNLINPISHKEIEAVINSFPTKKEPRTRWV